MREAIVIGINSYQGAPLEGCVSDAEDVAACLAFPNFDFSVTTLFESMGNRARILQEIGRRVDDTSDGGDFFLLYFAGHGQTLGGHGYLVTHDATPYDPGISLALVAQLMESASTKYRHVLTVLDCCYSGSAFNWPNSRPLAPGDVLREIGARNESRCILAACRPEELAYETTDGTHGEFTSALIRALTGHAVNFDGNVTVLSAYEYIAGSVPEAQTPVFKGDLSGNVVLGSGFDPRRGAPIRMTEAEALTQKIRIFLEEYSELYYKESLDPHSWKITGYIKCAQFLEPRLAWLHDVESRLPEIVRDDRWSGAADDLRGERRRFSDLSTGLRTRFGRVVESIGHGGFGNVWKLREDSDLVAFKVFHGNELDDPVKVQRFVNGFNNMKNLAYHPRIVQVHTFSQAPFGFTMDYIEGDNLRQAYIDNSDPEVALRLLLNVCETVEHANSNGVRHRDIKPENIIVAYRLNGVEPFLTDFDLAYHETNRTVTSYGGGVGGVLNYAAPEQMFAPNTAAARAETVDVYALGQLMYFIIVRADPTVNELERNCRSLSKRLHEWVDDRAAEELLELYRLSTSPEPKERPESILAFMSAVARAETYVLSASGRDTIPEDQFCGRLAHQYAGVGNFERNDNGIRMSSLSGQLELLLRVKSYSVNSNEVGLEYEVSLSSNIPVANQGAASRAAINARLDRAMRKFQFVDRHPGNKGMFQTYIVLNRVPLTVGGLAHCHEVLLSTIVSIENWG